ncbi:MAG: imidazole glycerol phosphate synthase subunit HisH [Chloroflexi bacterium]|nr:imidazole glycerol phosphate synthase subunit HisH [Chloroflexota bacterium]
MRNKTITMIDYGGSNLQSAFKAFEYVGADVQLTSDPEDVINADKLTLPGVGAFGSGMAAVRERGLEEAMKTAVAKGTPLLGICIGMQFLFDESDEMGTHKGLGLIPGRVTRFPATGLKVPHMGWNQLEFDTPHPLLTDVEVGSHTYFVHSYYCTPTDKTNIIATADYGNHFSAIVHCNNVYGLQFHPEKSQHTGLQIIKNYIELI